MKAIEKEKADLVVISTHGRGAENVDQVSAEFGSVAKKVIAKSPVPVHLVNPLKK
jgi:nucleotide-binding universal stress UspA family protein